MVASNPLIEEKKMLYALKRKRPLVMGRPPKQYREDVSHDAILVLINWTWVFFRYVRYIRMLLQLERYFPQPYSSRTRSPSFFFVIYRLCKTRTHAHTHTHARKRAREKSFRMLNFLASKVFLISVIPEASHAFGSVQSARSRPPSRHVEPTARWW